ncbi:DUF512 domain-containing protein [Phosphitispora fastidiosa]|uniref:DUF512 domain-containing protein n=1 Tax=Phosphitispora fastidiosa TaxID=2837202 RepID=UPI001E29FC77|nr:putative radical SAM enzyme (TIGR03279 family) [Phosphitispora fastidiosa]
MGKQKPVVDVVRAGSIADELGVERGDRLLTINGSRPGDLIDYRFLCADDYIQIEVMKKNGEVWACDIEKDFDEDLGIGFVRDTFDGIRNCANRCIFCFVDQMPPGMRETLYVKDDDFRLSFLHGNFITLTNLTAKDMERIVSMRLSPLYISVHTTNPELRKQMLGSPKAVKIMQQMSTLAEAGIEMHAQIVLCPGINDGPELDRTIGDLGSLYPGIKSVAIVPVGLTRFRRGLADLRKFTRKEAGYLIEHLQRLREGFLGRYGDPLIYPADEFFVLAGQGFPPAEYYRDFPQLENGVGLVRLFYDSFEGCQGLLPEELAQNKSIAIVTGASGGYVLEPVVNRLNRVRNLHVKTICAVNAYFGEDVTAAGLLTGQDIIDALKREETRFDLILLPSVTCKKDEPVFLDGKTPDALEQELGIKVQIVDTDQGAEHLIKMIID